MNRLQRLIRDHKAATGETYEQIARRGGIPKSTVQNIATTEQRRQTPNPATIEGLARGLRLSIEEVRSAAGEAAGYGAPPGDRDRLLVELEEYAEPLDDERKRELIALARYMMQQSRESGGDSGRQAQRKPRQ